MRIFRCLILSVLVIFALTFSNLAQADSYSKAIEVFKNSAAVQPFIGGQKFSFKPK